MMSRGIQGQGAGLSPEARFWRSVVRGAGPDGQCWQWVASGNQKGYGRFSVDGRHVMVHRFSYELHIGPIPEGLEVGHKCHNRRCVNPDHLEAMTHRRNMLMRYEREGAPCSELGRPMTSTERNRRMRERRRAEQ
jgi:hypothetical protein